MLRTLPLLSFVLIAGLAAGCDSQDSLLGEFVGSDAVDGRGRAVEGEAVYTIAETAFGPEVVLGLFVGDLFDNDRDEYDYVLFRLPGDRLSVGAVAIDQDPGYRVAQATIARAEDADDVLDTFGVLLTGTDGTLAITAVDSHGFAAGSYRFDAQGLRVLENATPSRATGSARGVFEARYVSPSAFRRLGLDLGL